MPSGKPSIGELYNQIPSTLADFGKLDTRLVKREVPWFVGLCRNIHARFPTAGGKNPSFNQRNKEAIEFLDWDLKPEELSSATNVVLLGSVLAAVLVGAIAYFSPLGRIAESLGGETLAPVYLMGVPMMIAVVILMWFQNYLVNAAKKEQVRSLTYIPEIVGYLNLSMKLVPNLEKAIEFAAEHGRGKIADDFKRLIWDVQLGVYSTLSEGLDVLAYRWGNFSSEFKKALMMIRASVIEDSEIKRHAVLDKTMDEVLSSVREKMEAFARGLSQPTVALFYVGILLPLILIIILPIGSAFSNMPFANPFVLALIYCIMIPLATLILSKGILDTRPPIYEPPVIPNDYPGLPGKWGFKAQGISMDLRLVLALILVAGIGSSLFLSIEGFPPKFLSSEDTSQLVQLIPFDKSEEFVLKKSGFPIDYYEEGGPRFSELVSETGATPATAKIKLATEKKAFFMAIENDVAPYSLIFGSLLTLSAAAAIYFYFTSIHKRRIQSDIMQMESEFKDSIYILASRLGENKPVENALRYTKDFLPNAKISERIFGRTIDNISLLAMPLEAAVFDPNYGSLKNIPSNLIRTSMKLLVDSVKLGVNVAARTMISLSMQLDNIERVGKMVKSLVGEMTSTMRTMVLFVGPVVLGITTSLQRIVVVTIASVSYQASTSGASAPQIPASAGSIMPASFSNMSIGSLIKPEAVASMADPTQFIIIIAIYVIELILILTYFTTKLEEDNDLLVKQNLATAIPIAVTMFVVSVIVANTVITMFLGGGMM